MIEIIKKGEYTKPQPKKIIHTCYRCGTIYSYIKDKDASNDYSDQEDFNHYDCPVCKLQYYPVFKFFGWLYYKVLKRK